MSAGSVLQAAVVAALRGDAALAALTGVFDAPPVRSALPHALVEGPVLTLWGAKDFAGREGRLGVVLYDAGERPVRLRALSEAVEARVEGLARELGGGWRVAALRLARSRVTRTRDDRWLALSEFGVRMYRVDS